MAKLPFVVEPRLKPVLETIGSEDSGKIQVERRGYLTAGEKAFVGSSVSSNDVASVIIGIVRTIAKKYKMDMQECYKLVTDILTIGAEGKTAEKIAEEYRTELGEITAAMVAQEQRREFIQAFCMLLYRVDATFTAEDAMDLHPDLLEGLSRLYSEEEKKSVERLIDDMGVDGSEDTAVEDIEKK